MLHCVRLVCVGILVAGYRPLRLVPCQPVYVDTYLGVSGYVSGCRASACFPVRLVPGAGGMREPGVLPSDGPAGCSAQVATDAAAHASCRLRLLRRGCSHTLFVHVCGAVLRLESNMFGEVACQLRAPK